MSRWNVNVEKEKRMKKDVFKVGDKIQVVKDTCNHRYPVGAVLTVLTVQAGCGVTTYRVEEGQCSVTSLDIKSAIITSDDFRAEIARLEKEIKVVKDKIDFLEEIGSDIYNEKEFAVFQCLKTLENSSLSLAEKAKKIANQFN